MRLLECPGEPEQERVLATSWVEVLDRRPQLAQRDESFNVVVTFCRPGRTRQHRRKCERHRYSAHDGRIIGRWPAAYARLNARDTNRVALTTGLVKSNEKGWP